MSTDIAKFSSSGHLLQLIDAGEDFEPSLPGSLAVDASGRLYEQASDDTVRTFDTSGDLIAVWPDGGGNLTAENGDVYATGPGNLVTRFSDFLNPLPAVPNSSQSPFAQGMQASLTGLMSVSTATQTTSSVKAPLTCTGSATCSGTIELTRQIAAPRTRKTRVEIIGRTTFKIRPNHRIVAAVRLNRTAVRTLRTGPIRVTLTVDYTAGKNHKKIARKLILRRQRQQHAPGTSETRRGLVLASSLARSIHHDP